MTKKIDMLGLERAVPGVKTELPQDKPKGQRPASRQGTVLLSSHHDPAVVMQLKVIAAEERTTQQDLISEALNMLFARYGRPQIAASKRRG